MELTLLAPTLRWSLPRDLPSPTSESVACTMSLERSPQQPPRVLPCTLKLPVADTPEFAEFLAQRVTFSLMHAASGEQLLTHSVALRECVPVLTEAWVTWRGTVDWEHSEGVVDVEIRAVVDKEPRELVKKLIRYKGWGHTIVKQLSLHRNAVTVGLLPPFLGCSLGVLVTSPMWVPLTLLVMLLGFPLWIVLAIGLSLLIVVSSVLTVLVLQFVRSKHLRGEAKRFLQGPHGQLLLFRGASPDEGKLKHLVMDDPTRKLIASLVLDFIGCATFALPLIGELADLGWAPLSASLLMAMYSESWPNVKYLAFMEEWLPFTDIIPTATLAWIKENASSVGQVRAFVASLRNKGGITQWMKEQ